MTPQGRGRSGGLGGFLGADDMWSVVLGHRPSALHVADSIVDVSPARKASKEVPGRGMALQKRERSNRLFDLAAHGARAAALAIALTGSTLVWLPVPAAASQVVVQSPAAQSDPAQSNVPPVDDGNKFKCRPHPGKGENPHCPPPVIPEAPMAVLLPVTAGGMLAGFYIYARRRSGAGLAV